MSGEGSSVPPSAPDGQVEKKGEELAAAPAVPTSTTSPAPAVAGDSQDPTAKDVAADAKPEPATANEETASSHNAQGDTLKPDAKASTAETQKSEIKPLDQSTEQDNTKMEKVVTEKVPTAGEADAADGADDSVMADTLSTPSADKSKGRRKSGAAATSSAKKLNKKSSKAKFFHLDAQPGEHFLVKLKGHPQWPVIIADEEMLPDVLLQHRPVTARRADGTYRDDYADGGKRANDRTFPVMYLRTNEFGYVPNSALQELPSDKAQELLTDKVKKKELREAFELAIEQHPLDHYKKVLQEWQIDRDAELERLAELEAEKKEKEKEREKKKKRQSTSAAVAATDEDGDISMTDPYAEGEVVKGKTKSAKKRKAEETATPQRSDSVKKPKIKLTMSSTPKATNGAAAPKTSKDTASAKTSKPKKDGDQSAADKVPPNEESEEDKHTRRGREVLFLRHRLQKGLLTRDQIPKEEEMKHMSDFIGKLEALPDLEVSIIRSTKINKVLKAILKLDSIPRESEFNFKPRSQVLLDKWNKILSNEPAPTSATNGVNGSSEKKAAPASATESNGVKQPTKESEGEAPSGEAKAEPKKAEAATEAVDEDQKSAEKTGEDAAPISAAKAVEAEA